MSEAAARLPERWRPSANRPVAAPSVPAWVVVAGVACVAVYVGFVAVGLGESDFEIISATIVVPILLAVTVPVARRIARAEGDSRYTAMILAAFGLKMIGGLLRHYVAYGVYNGSDASQYHRWGSTLAESYRDLDFGVRVGAVPGTGFIRAVTGVVYAVVGTSRLTGFLVFSWFGFLGLLLFWRAFRAGLPDGDGRRYFHLVLLLPSMLYWPSSIGKESWMVMVLGVCAYGVARSLSGRPATGLVILAIGAAGVTAVRPHLALVVFNGLVVAFLLRRPRSNSPLSPIATAMVAVLLLGAGLVLVNRVERFFGVESLTAEVVVDQLNEAETHTTQGGSEFTPVQVRSPLDLPLATLTVLFRPLPHEVKNAQAALTAFETMLILGFTLWSLPRFRRAFALLRSSPYVGYCIGFTLTFIVAFSSFGNFGLLARQRVQVLPAYLVLLCLPKSHDDSSADETVIAARAPVAVGPKRA